ncbi:MAG: AAA family ATPase [Actinomycetota bacterium]
MRLKRSSPHINIAGNRHGFPYSKGLLASSMMIAGISPDQAYRVAEKVEQILAERGVKEISSTELRDLSASLLAEIHERYASSYLRWQAVEELDCPLVILLGGATGVGKSTVATQLATRLGITRVISTDAIREVLRAAFSEEVMPVLYVSSFNADTALRMQLPSSSDQLIVGFQEQVCAVSVGIKALIARALEEGTDIIVEGAHVVPGYLEGWEEKFPEAVLVPVVITVSDEEAHRSHFHLRMMETPSRPRDRYLSGFDKIRAIQSYISGLARERGVPVVEMFELDSALQEIAAIVVAKALEKAQARGEANSTLPQTFDLDESEEMSKKSKPPRLRSREILGGRRKARAIP